MNRTGTPENLVAAHPANRNAERHGLYSRSHPALEARASEVAETIVALPHVRALDGLAAGEIGRLLALIERMDGELDAQGMTNRRGEARSLLKLRLAASRRLEGWLAAFAMTPRSRAAFIHETATGSLAAEIARRRAEIEESVA